MLVDTLGLLLAVYATLAGISERASGQQLLAMTRLMLKRLARSG